MKEEKKKVLVLGATSSEISIVERIQQMGETGHRHSLGRLYLAIAKVFSMPELQEALDIIHR